jgi:hypothetical protein
MDLVANVLSSKFWEVKKDGKKLAFIQETSTGYTLRKTDLQTFTNKSSTENFNTLFELIEKYQITFDNTPVELMNPENDRDVFGYEADSIAYNKVLDYRNGLPIYTKEPDSKSFYCAGWYSIPTKNGRMTVSNPKIITLKRVEFLGPYKTEQEVPNI